MKPFLGVKIALIYNGRIICIQRDNKPGLNFPGMWDLPGGGRENEETPIETAQREVFEELHITLNADSIIHQREYPAMIEKNAIAYFLVSKITKEQFEKIIFGNEGQGWKLATKDELLNDENTVPYLRGRLNDLVDSSSSTGLNLL